MEFLTCEHFAIYDQHGKAKWEVLLGFERIPGTRLDSSATYLGVQINSFHEHSKGKSQKEIIGNRFIASNSSQIPVRYANDYRHAKQELLNQDYQLIGVYNDACIQDDGTIVGTLVDVSKLNDEPTPSISWVFWNDKKSSKEKLLKCFALVNERMQLPRCDDAYLNFPGYKLSPFMVLSPRSGWIDLERMSGGSGELLPENGIEPLLAFMYMNTILDEHEGKFAFSTEDAKELVYTNFESLKEPFIKLFGYDENDVRKVAVQLGLASEMIDLSHVETNLENFYF